MLAFPGFFWYISMIIRICCYVPVNANANKKIRTTLLIARNFNAINFTFVLLCYIFTTVVICLWVYGTVNTNNWNRNDFRLNLSNYDTTIRLEIKSCRIFVFTSNSKIRQDLVSNLIIWWTLVISYLFISLGYYHFFWWYCDILIFDFSGFFCCISWLFLFLWGCSAPDC